MKDPTDASTIELFPVVKKAGRPSTGIAKTSAQRQRAYRNKKKQTGGELDLGHKNLNCWVDRPAQVALERLSRKYGKTAAEMIEQLIKDADKTVKSSMNRNSDEYDQYVETPY